MHRVSILLVKASTSVDAREAVDNFLSNYQDNVYDRYEIGWRWTGILKGSKIKQFENISYIIMWIPQETTLIPQDMIDKHKDQFQQLRTELWFDGENPYNNYNQSTSRSHDIMSLAECLDTVNEYKNKINPRSYRDKMMKEKDDWSLSMSWYYAKIYWDLVQESFSFYTPLYNVEESDYSIPKDTTGYYAVVVDMHN